MSILYGLLAALHFASAAVYLALAFFLGKGH